jgi:hypothetical protein
LTDFELLNSDQDMVGYFNRSNIKQIANKFKSSKSPESYNLIKDSLEALFITSERLINESKNFLYQSSPVSVDIRTIGDIDQDLQFVVNKLNNPSDSLWLNDPIRNLIKFDTLKFSYLDYYFNVTGDIGKCVFYFKYIPDGTEHKLKFNLKLDKFPKELISYEKIEEFEWSLEFKDYFYNKVKAHWEEFYDLDINNYNKTLYESILSDKKGLNINDFYVSSYYKNKSKDNIYWEAVENLSGFSDISTEFKSKNSLNVLLHTLNNTSDSKTINPDFKKGLSCWNVISTADNKYGYLKETDNNKDNTLVINNIEEDLTSNLNFNYEYAKIQQENILDQGYWELDINYKTNVTRAITLFVNDNFISQTIFPTGSNFVNLKLTGNGNQGVLIEDGLPVKFGFVLSKVTDDELYDSSSTSINSCKLTFKQLNP